MDAPACGSSSMRARAGLVRRCPLSLPTLPLCPARGMSVPSTTALSDRTTNKSAVSLVADDCFRVNPRESAADADASSPPRRAPRRHSSARRCAAPPCLPPSVGIRIASTMSCSPAPSTSCAKAPTRSPARCSVPRRLSDGCHASSPGALGEPLRRPTAACYHYRYHPGPRRPSRQPRSTKNPAFAGFFLTRQERFELPTFGSVDRRSIQLSYWRRGPSLMSAQPVRRELVLRLLLESAGRQARRPAASRS